MTAFNRTPSEGGPEHGQTAPAGQYKGIFEFPPSFRAWVTWDLSPDGKWLALGLSSHETGARLKTISATGGELKQLFEKSGRTISNVAWTRDGQRVLFMAQKGFQGGELWQISAADGEPRKLLESDFAWSYSLSMHPDGQRIAFHAGTNMHEMWVMENFLSAE